MNQGINFIQSLAKAQKVTQKVVEDFRNQNIQDPKHIKVHLNERYDKESSHYDQNYSSSQNSGEFQKPGHSNC